MNGRTIQLACDGLLVAPVGAEGPWDAFRELRAGMRKMAGADVVRTSFVAAFTRDGHPAVDSGDTAILVAGFQRRPAA